MGYIYIYIKKKSIKYKKCIKSYKRKNSGLQSLAHFRIMQKKNSSVAKIIIIIFNIIC